MSQFTLAQQRFFDHLIDIQAVKFDGDVGFAFKLHDTRPEVPLAPCYINLRTPDNPKPGPLRAASCQLAGMVYREMVEAAGIEWNTLGAIPNAGGPLGDGFDAVLEFSRLRYPFVKDTSNGGRCIITDPDANFGSDVLDVLLLDDLVTAADTKLEALRAVRTARHIVKALAVLFDYEKGGRELLEEQDCQVLAAATVSDFFGYYALSGRVERSLIDKSLEWIDRYFAI